MNKKTGLFRTIIYAADRFIGYLNKKPPNLNQWRKKSEIERNIIELAGIIGTFSMFWSLHRFKFFSLFGKLYGNHKFDAHFFWLQIIGYLLIYYSAIILKEKIFFKQIFLFSFRNGNLLSTKMFYFSKENYEEENEENKQNEINVSKFKMFAFDRMIWWTTAHFPSVSKLNESKNNGIMDEKCLEPNCLHSLPMWGWSILNLLNVLD